MVHTPTLFPVVLVVVVSPARCVFPHHHVTPASPDHLQVNPAGVGVAGVVPSPLVGDEAQHNATEDDPWGNAAQGQESEAEALLAKDIADHHNYVLLQAAANSQPGGGGGGGGVAVRKCCEVDSFFNKVTGQCEVSSVDLGFVDLVRSIHIHGGGRQGGIELVPGLLNPCPGTGEQPDILPVVEGSHVLVDHGYLRNQDTGYDHDHDHYCLELVVPGFDHLEAAKLEVAECPTNINTRKCCGLNQYYDSVLEECLPKLPNMSDHEALVKEFIHSETSLTSIQVQTGPLSCDSTDSRMVRADQAILYFDNYLCEQLNDKCYNTSNYCLEYTWAMGDSAMTPIALLCPEDAFHKCCLSGSILTDTGCAATAAGDISLYMRQLLEELKPHYGFPTENGGQVCEKDFLTLNDSDVQWLISRDGYLSMETERGRHATMRYCVDDYLGPSNKIQTAAIICQDEVEQVIPLKESLHHTQEGTVGKCCPDGYHFSSSALSCTPDEEILDLLQHTHIRGANITKLTYTSYPDCHTVKGYHHYYIDPDMLDDHALLYPDHMVEVIGMESGCEFTSHSFPPRSYCLEYTVNGSDKRPVVLVCPRRWRGVNLHSEKFNVTGILLGVSCAALFATAVSLVSARVKRGLITVKKVNTLAGRILVSYVLSYLAGFLILLVNMKVEVKEGNSECQIMAWLLIFFLLAAFQWNTSICLESLLLTLHVETSEGLRYFYHSLWAWGLPAFIASLALTLDHYRQSLPCSVITPKIGLYNCFFSDSAAQLVYFYTPMLMSLVANMILLLVSRYVRAEKLRRLECGPKKKQAECDETEMEGGADPHKAAPTPTSRRPSSSGLRTHQTRNVWLESVKLVMWSGVTWLLEVISFVISKYIVTPSESWYDYLWYVPSSVNALRGVGIFVILVLTPERRVQIRTLMKLARQFCISRLGKSGKGDDPNITCGRHGTDMPFSDLSGSEVDPNRRHMSNEIVITQHSSVISSHSNDSRPDSTGPSQTHSAASHMHPPLATSVSQVEARRGAAAPSPPCPLTGMDQNWIIEAAGAGGRRRSSLAPFGGGDLPSVNEEEDVISMNEGKSEA